MRHTYTRCCNPDSNCKPDCNLTVTLGSGQKATPEGGQTRGTFTSQQHNRVPVHCCYISGPQAIQCLMPCALYISGPQAIQCLMPYTYQDLKLFNALCLMPYTYQDLKLFNGVHNPASHDRTSKRTHRVWYHPLPRRPGPLP